MWDVLAPIIRDVRYPLANTDADMQAELVNILEHLLSEKAQLWVFTRDQERPLGIVLTTHYREPITYLPILLIYALYTFEMPRPDEWEAGLNTLKRYADGIGAKKMVAYTNQPTFLHLLERFGADTTHTLIVWD